MALSGAWGHDGSFSALEGIIDFHLNGGGRDLSGSPGAPILERDRAALLVFLIALIGNDPGLPWNNGADG